MVAAVSARTPNPKLVSKPQINDRNSGNAQLNAKRPPLLPSEAENGNTAQLRRPKSREVTSRYLSSPSTSSSSSISTSSSSNSSNSISSRRPGSPMVPRTAAKTPVPQSSVRRAQSAERRRPGTPRMASEVGLEMSNAAKTLITSKRSLSVSFQGESFSMPMSKAKPAPSPAPPQSVNGMSNTRRGTPERRRSTPVRDRLENSSSKPSDQLERRGTPERRRSTPVRDRLENSSSKPSDQPRWPGRSKPVGSGFMTRSLDYGAPAEKPGFNRSVSIVKTAQKSLGIGNAAVKTEAKLSPDIESFEVVEKNTPAVTDDAAPSDSDSVSSGSTSGSSAQLRVPRGIVVPARFWQETNNRVRRISEPGSPASNNSVARVASLSISKFPGAKKFSSDGSITSSPRGFSSPTRGAVRPASPSKLCTPSIGSSFRGMASPVKTRSDVCSTPSILNFAADMRRVKAGESRVNDAHELRLLHNKQLQWRFANARAEAALQVQTETAERTLYNAWWATSKLRHGVQSKRLELQLLNHNLRLFSVLEAQVPYLDTWDEIEVDHATALSEATKALEASTVRLPIVGGAKTDILDVRNAISSAVDVMQSMASSIGSLLTKVEEVNTFLSELASLTTNECALIYQCEDLLSNLTTTEVKDCSLRTHVLQLRRMNTSLTTEL